MPAEFEPWSVILHWKLAKKVSAHNENAACRNSALFPISVEGQNKWREDVN